MSNYNFECECGRKHEINLGSALRKNTLSKMSKEEKSEMGKRMAFAKKEKRRKNPELYISLSSEEKRIKKVMLVSNRELKKKNLGGKFSYEQLVDIKIKQEYRCAICNEHESQSKLTIDHIIPVSRWNEFWNKAQMTPDYLCNDIENIQLLCRSCNSKKGTKIDILDIHSFNNFQDL